MRTTTATLGTLATATLLSLTLTGCGGSEDEPAAATETSPTSATAAATEPPTPVETPSATASTTPPGAGTGACPLLDVGFASTTVETELQELVADADGCSFMAADGSGLTVDVSRSQVAGDPNAFAAQTRDQCENDPDPDLLEVDAGEDVSAFVCNLGGYPQGFWFGGTSAVGLSVAGTETPAKAFSLIADLLPAVTAQ